MKSKVEAVTASLVESATHYAAISDYSSLVKQVVQIGGKAYATNQFSIKQAEQLTAMMIAAITLAKEVNVKQ